MADSHTYFVGTEDWGFSVWAHNAYFFRGDTNHVPGSGSMGKAIDPAASDADRAQMAFDQVKQNLGHATSLFTSWSTDFNVALFFAGGDPKRVTKVKDTDMLALEGVRVSGPDEIRDLIKDHGAKKIAKKANDIRQDMVKNEEFLIEGIIPADVQKPGK